MCNLFQAPQPRRASWDTISDKERAKRIRLLQLYELGKDPVWTGDKDEQELPNWKVTAPKTGMSQNFSPNRSSEAINPAKKSAKEFTDKQVIGTEVEPDRYTVSVAEILVPKLQSPERVRRWL